MTGEIRNIHPGEILREEFLIPMQMSASKLAHLMNVEEVVVNNICDGKQKITPSISRALSCGLGTTASLWMGLQDDYNRQGDN